MVCTQNLHPLSVPEHSPDLLLTTASSQVSLNCREVDSVVLDLLHRERCYRSNRSPAERGAKRLSVLERRLRLGVHNSLCYVEEPVCLVLDEQSGALSARRRSRSLSRAGQVDR